MCAQACTGIVVEKTLHEKDAFVRSMGYLSPEKPILREAIELGDKFVYRVSEDNGKTWKVTGDAQWEEKRGECTAERRGPVLHYDPNQKVLIEFVTEQVYGPEGDYPGFTPNVDATPLQSRTGRIFYHFSRDEGKSWAEYKQLIQAGSQFDDKHWAEGIYYEKNAASFDELLRVTQLRDGTLVIPVHLIYLDTDGKLVKHADRFGEFIWPREACATFVGRWKKDGSDIDWEMSNIVDPPAHVSAGVCEPAVAEMENGNLMMLMRGGTCAWESIPSVKLFTVSKDGGRSWGPPVPLTYPDGSFVYSPASCSNLFRCSKNGKVYAIANILPEPTRQSDPRYPLKIVEIDQDYFWALPETETVIADREPRHSSGVRFSNWQRMEDQVTGNPVIYLTEAMIDTVIPSTDGVLIPDAYRYEMVVPD